MAAPPEATDDSLVTVLAQLVDSVLHVGHAMSLHDVANNRTGLVGAGEDVEVGGHEWKNDRLLPVVKREKQEKVQKPTRIGVILDTS